MNQKLQIRLCPERWLERTKKGEEGKKLKAGVVGRKDRWRRRAAEPLVRARVLDRLRYISKLR